MKWLQFPCRQTPQTHPSKHLALLTTIALTTATLLPLTCAFKAEAGFFDIFSGGRRGAGSASGTDRGGAVRAGRAIGGADPNVPYIISPRNTWLANDQFTIRWNSIPGVNRYTIRLWRWAYGEDRKERILWKATIVGNQFQYSGPKLEAGRLYSIEIEADNGASSEADRGAAKTGFELLFPEDLAILQQDLKSLQARKLSEEDYAISLAQLYLRENLLADAIHTLEELTHTDPKNALAYGALGETYSYAGLNDLAQKYYKQALTHAIASQNLEYEAAAKLGLAQVNALAGDKNEAIRWFVQAQAGYKTLGDEAEVARIQRRIRFLRNAP